MKHVEIGNEHPFRWFCAKMQEKYNSLNKLLAHLKQNFIIIPIKDSFRDSSINLITLTQMDQVLQCPLSTKETFSRSV